MKTKREILGQRVKEEINRFMSENRLTMIEAAKALGISIHSLRNFRYDTDQIRLPRLETFADWAEMSWPVSFKIPENKRMIDIHYIITGRRSTIKEEIQAERLERVTQERDRLRAENKALKKKSIRLAS